MSTNVSVFIMDISNSSQEQTGHELSEYLEELKTNIVVWTQYIVETKISHRAGDELVVVCKGYATAYTLAYYINHVWKFSNHKPYFGLTFGEIPEKLSEINLETWIHPLMKQARNASDHLKNQQNRSQFHFALTNVSGKQSFTVFNKQFETLINTSLMLKQEQMNEQTDIQSLVCSLYFILGQQTKVSDYLERTTPTISHHMRQGKTQTILRAFHDIVNVLDSLDTQDEQGLNSNLQSNIKRNIQYHLHNYIPKDRRLK